jgi:hypothetical protein
MGEGEVVACGVKKGYNSGHHDVISKEWFLGSDRMVVLEHVESLSFETVRRVLKKTNLSLG